MRRNILMMAVAIGVAASSLTAARADDDTEARLRDALRSTTSQLRQLQDDQVAQQAREAELQKQNDTLRSQVATLQQQQQNSLQQAQGGGKPDQAALDQAVAEFNKKLQAQNDAIAKMNGDMGKWQAAYNQAATVARAKEAERAQLAAKVDGLSKSAATCTTKNDALVKVANEILDRYQHMDLGEALGKREPFVGLERVKLENIVQDYQDKIQDQTVVPPTAP